MVLSVLTVWNWFCTFAVPFSVRLYSLVTYELGHIWSRPAGSIPFPYESSEKDCRIDDSRQSLAGFNCCAAAGVGPGNACNKGLRNLCSVTASMTITYLLVISYGQGRMTARVPTARDTHAPTLFHESINVSMTTTPPIENKCRQFCTNLI
jgi:hypothetical protein